MSQQINTITIYASASSRISPVSFEAAGKYINKHLIKGNTILQKELKFILNNEIL